MADWAEPKAGWAEGKAWWTEGVIAGVGTRAPSRAIKEIFKKISRVAKKVGWKSPAFVPK